MQQKGRMEFTIKYNKYKINKYTLQDFSHNKNK